MYLTVRDIRNIEDSVGFDCTVHVGATEHGLALLAQSYEIYLGKCVAYQHVFTYRELADVKNSKEVLTYFAEKARLAIEAEIERQYQELENQV